MNNEELIARINSLSVTGSDGSDLSNQRALAMDHYLARPYGDELDGRSQVVSRDLMEVVDWALPELMNVFLASGNVVDFVPMNDEDVEAAEQESDYVNHVLIQENNCWLVFHDWFWDALVLKNGYVKTFWEEEETFEVQKLEGLTEEELTLVMENKMVEVSRQAEYIIDDITVFDVEIRIKTKRGKVTIECCPPEEIRVSRNARGDINSADYVEHITHKPRTDLIAMGMDRDFVDNLAASAADDGIESISRDTTADDRQIYDAIDQSMELVEYRECYVRVDFDDDGEAELRRVIIVGNKIPDGDEWNEEVDHIPFSSITPKRMPHRHIGESMDDEISDIQEIKTVLQRQFLDNLYGLVNQEWLVNERVNLDDFLVTRPLGVKRVKGMEAVDGSARAVEKPPVLQHVLPAIDYWETTRSQRTGIRPEQSGLSPDELKNLNNGTYFQNLKQGNVKLSFMARMFAETGIKDLARKVHRLLLEHMDEEKVIQLRGKYVNIQPSQWKTRTDMTVNVGLGTGDKREQRENAMLIAQWQQQLGQLGLVSPKNAYNTFSDISESMGYLTPSRWVLDPDSQEYQQHQQKMMQQKKQPNPLAEAENVKAQAAMQIATLKSQLKVQEIQASNQTKSQEMQMKWMTEQMKEQNKKAIAIMREEVRALIEGFNADIGKPGLGAEL